MDFNKIIFNRIIIHKIHGKTKVSEAYTTTSNEIHKLDTETEDALKERILKATTKSKRFFETAVKDTSEGSFWYLTKN